MKLRHHALTDVGSVRKRNEDSILVVPEINLFMVADGMGGEKAGAEASAQVVKTVEHVARKFFEAGEPKEPGPLGDTLRNCLNQANKDVFDISRREPDKTGLGSTGSVLCLHRGLYLASQVGDSRIYLVRGNDIKQITHDHTIVWTLYENGVITRDQLETHPDRHLLTQCVGSAKPIEVDLFMDRLQANDLLLICSDGLTGYAGEGKVFQILRESELSLEDRAKKLLKAALDGGGGDNVSIILVQVDALDPEDTWAPSAVPEPHKAVVPEPARTVTALPKAATAPEEPAPVMAAAGPSQAGRYLAVAAAIVVLVVGSFLAARMIPKTVERQIKLVGFEDFSLRVLDSEGKPVAHTIVRFEGDTFTLELSRKKAYRLHLEEPNDNSIDLPKSSSKEPITITLTNGKIDISGV